VDHQAAATPPVHSQLRGRSALIVDDLPLKCEVLQEILENEGMTCFTAQSGPEAVVLLQPHHREEQPFDFAILDFSMPKMNGEQLTSTLTVDPACAETIVVMLSAADDIRDRECLQRSGLSAWLTKPVRIGELCRLLTNLLNARERGLPSADGIDKRGKPLPAPPESKKSADNDDASFSGLRILLVEDNRINRAMAQERLVGLNCDVATAENGREAVEQVQHTPFDLILMDCQMPEMDGFEAIRKIRKMIRTGKVAPIPIIAMTANAMIGDRGSGIGKNA
jgi:CheY-like chemotaxis protein